MPAVIASAGDPVRQPQATSFFLDRRAIRFETTLEFDLLQDRGAKLTVLWNAHDLKESGT